MGSSHHTCPEDCPCDSKCLSLNSLVKRVQRWEVSNIQLLTLTFVSVVFTFFCKIREMAKMNSRMVPSSKSLQNVLPSVSVKTRELPGWNLKLAPCGMAGGRFNKQRNLLLRYILGITRQISVPALQNLKIYVEVQPCLQSRWSQQHIALKPASLKWLLGQVEPASQGKRQSEDSLIVLVQLWGQPQVTSSQWPPLTPSQKKMVRAH